MPFRSKQAGNKRWALGVISNALKFKKELAMYIYDAILKHERDGSYFIDFPVFDGCFSDGATKEEAINEGAEMLRLLIADFLDRGDKLPAYRQEKARDVITIAVEVDSSFIQETKCMTVTEASKELNVSKGRVSQMLTTGVLQAVSTPNSRLVTIASVNKRKREKRGAGRPKQAVAM